MEQETITKDLARFNITDAVISEKASQYMPLTIRGIDDKPGLDAVHRARMDIKGLRVAVQKTGKALREEANTYLKVVLTEEKRIISLLEPIEDHLSDEENRVVEEVARIKAEAAAKEEARIQGRRNLLFKMGCTWDGSVFSFRGVEITKDVEIAKFTDELFDDLVGAIQSTLDEEAAERAAQEAAKKAEEERLAQIAKEQAVEKKRLEAEQARIKKEQEEKAKELAEKEAKLKADQEALATAKQKLIDDEAARVKAIEDEKIRVETEKKRAEELEKAKAEAAAKAVAAAAAKAAAEAEAKRVREEKARLAAERKAARRPDKEKLQAYRLSFGTIPVPELKTEDGIAALEKIGKLVGDVVVVIDAIIEEL